MQLMKMNKRYQLFCFLHGNYKSEKFYLIGHIDNFLSNYKVK